MSVIRVFSGKINGTDFDKYSLGSGVIVGNGNIALTCFHCVSSGPHIICSHSGRTHGAKANIIFKDAGLDIAVIEFEGKAGEPAKIRNSDTVLIGHEGFAAGFPIMSETVSVLKANIAGFEIINGIQYIKIDSSVNHGNSGGPLFNSAGEVIGIINAKKGELSDFLHQMERYRGVQININGFDAAKAIQELIKNMKTNLNLGMGNAIPISAIANASHLIAGILKKKFI
jgi:serine protease Do